MRTLRLTLAGTAAAGLLASATDRFAFPPRILAVGADLGAGVRR